MNTPEHDKSPWLKWTVALLAAGIVLLVAGAFPPLGTPGLYHNGFFLLIGLAIAILALFGAFFIRWRKPALFLLHIGCVLIVAGAFIDFALEKKVGFGIYVGDDFSSDIVLDERSETTIPLGFRFVIRDFDVEYYPPTYTLYNGETRDKLEDGVIRENEILFPKHKQTVSLSRFTENADSPHPLVLLDAPLIALQNKPVEKYYKASFRITDEGKTIDHELAVNHPVSYKGWKFYLMSHGQDQGKQYVRLTARNAPGRPWVATGIYTLMAGAFWFAFIRKPKKTKQA